MTSTDIITDKIREVRAEMEQLGLWKKLSPGWVGEYSERSISTENDFNEWLQFVYLPNLAQQSQQRISGEKKHYIVPQVIIFFGEDVKKGKLLQLLIELDALL